MPTIQMTEDEFYEKFRMVRNPEVEEGYWGGGFLNNSAADLEKIRAADPACVWTIVENDDGSGMSITEGFRRVNNIGFLITEVPAEPGTFYEISDPDMQVCEDEDEGYGDGNFL